MVVVEQISQPLFGPDVEGVWVVVLWAFGVVHSPSASYSCRVAARKTSPNRSPIKHALSSG